MMDLRGLAYVVAESTDLGRWRTYAEGVLGMPCETVGDGLRIKMDERQFRIAVEAGRRDAYLASGWEVLGSAEFAAAVATLERAGVAHAIGDAAQCAARGVQQLVAFSDPAGNRHEVVWGYRSDFTRFNSPAGVPRFVTGSIGMGHTVLPAPAFDATVTFVREVMGFGLSDIFNFKPAGDAGPVLPIHFFHCNNGRHHSLALCGFPVESGCVHVMVEVDDMPEVGRAMDRMAAHGVTQTATLGQHTNDRMISFYMRSPSNFDFEYGYGGAVVDWQQHIAHEFTKVSLWGHDFSIAQPKA
ncbi:MAG: VOC family protein [Burkholderiales bacterium]|nr:VOC family protein [Burkholderiales bacterium]MDE1926053.1 VOC family protein [Burkholderiales bacterium]MDE2157681.1 VOC family protein [Burkholderiales bacterium]MDE2502063.1 VOC family protein [Burkholderiales bacterium]